MIEKYALYRVFAALRQAAGEESVRSLARKAGVGVATSKRCLDHLLEKQMVKRKTLGRLYQYSLNEENFLTRQLKIAMSAAELLDAGVVEELAREFPQVSAIVLYGSTATGMDKPGSDIDMVLIVRSPLRLKPLHAEKRLRRELSLSAFTVAEWRRKAASDKPYYDAVIIDGLCLHGEMPVVS